RPRRDCRVGHVRRDVHGFRSHGRGVRYGRGVAGRRQAAGRHQADAVGYRPDRRALASSRYSLLDIDLELAEASAHGASIGPAPTKLPQQRTAEDTLAILDVVARYAFYIDDRDWEGLRQVFTADGVADYRAYTGEAAGSAGPFVGIDDIVKCIGE